MDLEPKKELFQSDFVYTVNESPFCGYSVDVDPKEPRYIIVCGYRGGETTFYEILTPSGSDVNGANCNFKLSFKSFTKDYKRRNADLEMCGLSKEKIVNSFITKDNKYIVILPSSGSYNIYDMEKDKWLNDGNDIESFSHQSKSLMIDDRILVISANDYLRFYLLNDKMIFELIQEYIIRDIIKNESKYQYCSHGMCCIESNCIKKLQANINIKEKEKEKEERSAIYSMEYEFKLMLFGGYVHCVSLCDTFVQFDVSITLSSTTVEGDKIDKDNTMFKVGERSLNGNKMTLVNMVLESRLYDFSTFIISKHDGNPVIVMIGGVLITPGYETCTLVTYDVKENILEAQLGVCNI